MSEKLPIGGFKWSSAKRIKELHKDLMSCDFSGADGAFIECDIEYPEELQDLHDDMPLAAQSVTVETAELSDHTRSRYGKQGRRHIPGPKLVTHFGPRTGYVCHASVLQFYVRHGLKVIKIHRAVEFRQTAWLAEFIALNTELRTKATTDFEKDFFKLMSGT